MRILMIGCFILLFALPVFGQAAGTIYLCSDSAGFDCSIVDTSPGFVIVHMLAYLPNGWAVQFAAPKPACWTGATYMGESVAIDLLPLGNTQSDIGLTATVGTPGVPCPGGASHSLKYIGFISYRTTGHAPACCEYPVIKATYDTYEEIPGPIGSVCRDRHVAGYPFEIVLMHGQSAIINPNASCPCMSTVPTEKNTWGAIKAFYQ